MTSIRQQGHFAEHTQAGPSTLYEGMKGGSGSSGKGRNYQHFYGNEDWQEDGDSNNAWSTLGSYLGAGDHHERSARQEWEQEEPEEAYAVDEEGWPCCSQCQSYFDDEVENDTDTESEMDPEEMAKEEAAHYYGPYGDEETYDSLKEEYLIHKRRFRRFAQRGPRRHRFPRRAWSMSFKGRKGRKGNFSLRQRKRQRKHAECYWSVLPSRRQRKRQRQRQAVL